MCQHKVLYYIEDIYGNMRKSINFAACEHNIHSQRILHYLKVILGVRLILKMQMRLTSCRAAVNRVFSWTLLIIVSSKETRRQLLVTVVRSINLYEGPIAILHTMLKTEINSFLKIVHTHIPHSNIFLE